VLSAPCRAVSVACWPGPGLFAAVALRGSNAWPVRPPAREGVGQVAEGLVAAVEGRLGDGLQMCGGAVALLVQGLADLAEVGRGLRLQLRGEAA